MVARIWHGRTSIENYDGYTEFMKERTIPDYKKTKGFVKLFSLRNIMDDAMRVFLSLTSTRMAVKT